MSRQNKVNPGMYTQRGRLTQDDAARELARQRMAGSPSTWQPVQRDRLPRFKGTPSSAGHDEETPETAPAVEKKAPAKTAARRQTKTAARKAPTKKATTSAKRGKTSTAKPDRTAKPKAKAAKRRKS